MAQQLAGDERKVSRGRERPLALAVQTVGIDECCSRAAELARPGVHPLDLVERQLLARLEPDLRAAH